MGLETGNFVEDLVTTNPPGGDSKSQGDDHIRLIKNVLRNTFKRATKALSFPGTISKSANYTVLSTDDGLTILCDTTAGSFTLTLPILAVGDAGWAIFVIKSSLDANAVFLQPASGTISGYAKVRRSIDAGMTRVTWTGGAFHATRPNGGVIGSSVPYHGGALPNGHLWPDGSAINAATYPELAAALGANLPDLRGRAPFGRDNMGAGAANRVTSGGSGIAGATLGAAGGEEVHTLASGELAQHSHSVTESAHSHGPGTLGTDSQGSHGHAAYIRDPNHDHSVPSLTGSGSLTFTGGTQQFANVRSGVAQFPPGGSGTNGTGVRVNSDSSAGRTSATDDAVASGGLHTHSVNTGSSGSQTTGLSVNNFPTVAGAAHQNMPPALICNFIIVAE